jgi:hypothetical protein
MLNELAGILVGACPAHSESYHKAEVQKAAHSLHSHALRSQRKAQKPSPWRRLADQGLISEMRNPLVL